MSRQVLLFTSDYPRARQEVDELGGRVTHRFTDAVFVAVLPDEVAPESLARSAPEPPGPLDRVSRMAAEAWRANEAEGFRPPAPEAGPGARLHPRNASSDPVLAEQARRMRERLEKEQGGGKSSGPTVTPGTPTSEVLRESVAVGILLVSGQSPYDLTEEEQTTVLQQVQQGLDFLQGWYPNARISFDYHLILVTVSATPCSDPTIDSYEQCEAPWRVPAMKQMGYDGTLESVAEYVDRLRDVYGTDWAYAAFFTKYPLHWFAYASGVRLCMNYDNDGWGPDQIGRVFAHETAHLFGAADEYRDSWCSCGGVAGYYTVPGMNCAFCAGDHDECLLDQNELSVCPWSAGQLGWRQVWSGNTTIRTQPGGIDPESCRTPGSAVFGGKLWLGYRGQSDETLYTATWDGSWWSGNKRIRDQPGGIDPESADWPGMAVYQDELWLVYRGKSDTTLYTATWDGSKWSGNKRIRDQPGGIDPESSKAPGVAVYQDKLWVVYRGQSDETLYTATWDGSKWSGNKPIKDQPGGISPGSPNTPAVAVYDGELWVAYLGGDGRLRTATFDGAAWAGDLPIANQPGGIDPRSDNGPALAEYGGLLYLVYRGESATDLWVSFYGRKWWGNWRISDLSDIDPRSNDGPSAAVFEDALYVAYKGDSSGVLLTSLCT